MASGGARVGAGRKKGTVGVANKLGREIARKIISGKIISPLEVMIAAMDSHYSAGELDAAAMIAKDAAPYIHPRLSSVEQTIDGNMNVGSIDAPTKEDRDAWLEKRRGLVALVASTGKAA